MINLVINQLLNHWSSASAEVRPHRPREAGEHHQGVRLAVELADGHAGAGSAGGLPVMGCHGGYPLKAGRGSCLGKPREFGDHFESSTDRSKGSILILSN